MSAQIHEELIYEGERTSMAFCPPFPGNDSRIAERSKEDLEADDLGNCTDCWRGYVGTWEIEAGRFYLVELKGKYQLIVAEPIFADWFSGVLRIPRGEIIQYVHMGYGSVFEEEVHVKIEQGMVTQTDVIDNRGKKHDKQLIAWLNLPGNENRFPGDGKELSPRHQRVQRRWDKARWASRRADLRNRMDAARKKAIQLGLASAVNMDRVIHDLPAADFRRYFGEFNVSRAFFRPMTRTDAANTKTTRNLIPPYPTPTLPITACGCPFCGTRVVSQFQKWIIGLRAIPATCPGCGNQFLIRFPHALFVITISALCLAGAIFVNSETVRIVAFIVALNAWCLFLESKRMKRR